MPDKSAPNRPRLLGGPDEIDAEWLGGVLGMGGCTADVAEFTATPIGSGNVSETVRVALTYRHAAEAPASVVCKFQAAGEDAHAHGIASGSYMREVGSYRMIGSACRTPRLFWVDGGAHTINLVMEDLTTIARAGDQVAGCGPADAEAVVNELARLHRVFHPLAAADTPSWAMDMANTAHYWVGAIERAMPILQRDVFDRLDSDERSEVVAASKVAHAWYTAPLTRAALTHGDPRVDNILFIDGQENERVQAVLIDWQLTGRRNPMHDVGYFLSGSIPVEDRRANEKVLLLRYGDVFGSGYPLPEIEHDYRRQLLSGLLTTIAAYGLIPITPAVDGLLLALIRRNVAAAIDWHSSAALAGES